MKRQIVLVQNTEIGGHLALSTFLTGLLQKYEKCDNDYQLICGYIDKEDELGTIKENITIHEMGTSYNKIKENLLFTRKSFRRLISIHRTKSIDIIHCLYPNSSLQSAVLFKLFVKPSVKIIYDVRSPRIEMSFANSWISKSKQWVKHLMHFSEKILARFVDHFVFISEGTKDYYKDKYHLVLNNNYSIIPTGVDVHQFSKGRISDDDLGYVTKSKLKSKLYGEVVNKYDTLVGYIGTISQMREMTSYLQQHLRELKHSNIFFAMIGSGDDLENLKEFVKNNKLEDRFFIPGKMKQSELVEYMHSFDYGRCHLPDIFVFRNSFPLKILEYMSAGVPVLASKIKTHSELEKVHPSIHIYGNTENLFEVIDRLAKNERYSESAEKMTKMYDWSFLYGKYLGIYEKLV